MIETLTVICASIGVGRMVGVPTPSPVMVTFGFVPNPLPAIAKVVVAPAFHEYGVIDPMLGVAVYASDLST